MLVSLVLVVLALAFYAFIAFSPEEVIRLGLAGMWVILALSLVIGFIVGPP